MHDEESEGYCVRIRFQSDQGISHLKDSLGLYSTCWAHKMLHRDRIEKSRFRLNCMHTIAHRVYKCFAIWGQVRKPKLPIDAMFKQTTEKIFEFIDQPIVEAPVFRLRSLKIKKLNILNLYLQYLTGLFMVCRYFYIMWFLCEVS